MTEVPVGFCGCGCGKRTKISPETYLKRGWIKGVPRKFALWHGNRKAEVAGYRGRSNKSRVHVLVAERAMGKPLPKGAVVHHVNGVKSDNRPENLVVCQDTPYHLLLHRRQRALDECGNPNWQWCWICRTYAPPTELKQLKYGASHQECLNAEARERYWKKKRSVGE